MIFPETTLSPIPREFLAIVLAGFGNDLSPLTNSHGEEPCLKALLPIANKPMITYVLQWIEEADINDVLVVCPRSHKMALSNYLNLDEYSSTLKINLEAYDTDDPTTGSIEALEKVVQRCEGDFVIVPCDFFPPPSLKLNDILNKFRVATDSLVLNTVWYEAPTKESSDDLPGPATAPLVVSHQKSESLLHIEYPDVSQDDDITLRMSMAWKYPRMQLHSSLVDSHVYVCKKGILELAASRAAVFESFREDFLPWLCKLQYQYGRKERHAQALAPLVSQSPNQIATQYSTSQPWDEHLEAQLAKLNLSDERAELFTESEAVDPKVAQLRVGFMVHREGQPLRANNLATYMELNRRLMSQTERVPPKEGIDPKALISPDSLVGVSTRVGERAVIKKSVVGRHCVIGKNARITGSVIGDHCVISDGAKIDSSILSRHTRVGEKAELVKCQTQSGYDVEPEEKVKGEKLQMNDWVTGALESDEEEESE